MTVLSGCGSVPVRDQEWCGDLGGAGATCFHTLISNTRDMDKATWDALRFGQVCTAASNFADTKAVIEKLCRATKNCVYEKVQAFFQRIEDFNLEAASREAQALR